MSNYLKYNIMKKVLITLVVVMVSLNLTAQKTQFVQWYNWSNPVSFQLSLSPLITGYGPHSDSLSTAFDGTTFYEYDGEYYQVKSWADYYHWYVNKFWFNFNEPELYEHYYQIQDDFQMAKYIAGKNYLGRYYPSRIYISFLNRDVETNRLSEKSRYIASNDKKVKKLEKQIEFSEEQYQKNHYKADKNNMVEKHNNKSKKDYNKLNTSGKKDYQKINTKEGKLYKYELKNSKSNSNYRKTTGSSTNTGNQSSSNVKSNSSKTKSPKQK